VRLAGATEARTSDALALEIAPVPASERVTLTLTLPSTSEVTIELVDAEGARARAPTNDSLSAGPHRITLDVATLSPGAYRCRVIAGELVESIPFVVVR
jgi:hypothetical protein